MLASRWRYYAGSVLPMLGASRHPVRLAAAMLGLRPSGFVWELRSGESFRVRSPLDAWIVKETWVDRSYEVAGAPVEDGWTVLDVGAGIGDFAVRAARACPSGRVLAIEPAEDAFALLEENLRRNGVAGVGTCRAAVGAPGDALAMRDGRSTVRSGAAPGAPHGAGTRPVPTLSLEDAFDRLGGDRCDLVKMDVEGAEERILLGAKAGTVRRALRYVLEVHEQGAPGRGEALSALFARLGFRTRRSPNPAWPTLHWLYAWRDDEPGRSASDRG